eukprot:gene10117-7213_t
MMMPPKASSLAISKKRGFTDIHCGKDDGEFANFGNPIECREQGVIDDRFRLISAPSFNSSSSSHSSSGQSISDEEFDDELDIGDFLMASFVKPMPIIDDESSLVPDDLRTPLRTRTGKIPRLLKHDIRRLYPTMFINMLNSHDHDFTSKYFQKFFPPTAKLEMLQDLSSFWSVQAIDRASDTVSGRDNILTYYNFLFRLFPDFCASVSRMEIQRNNHNRESTIKFFFHLSWTEVASQTASPLDQSDGKTLIIDKYAHELDAVATLHLDQSWYITQVEGKTLASSAQKIVEEAT